MHNCSTPPPPTKAAPIQSAFKHFHSKHTRSFCMQRPVQWMRLSQNFSTSFSFFAFFLPAVVLPTLYSHFSWPLVDSFFILWAPTSFHLLIFAASFQTSFHLCLRNSFPNFFQLLCLLLACNRLANFVFPLLAVDRFGGLVCQLCLLTSSWPWPSLPSSSNVENRLHCQLTSSWPWPSLPTLSSHFFMAFAFFW